MKKSYEKGLQGEQIAAQYLEAIGYKILKTRYRIIGGEIDLIVKDGDVTCFVEVKYRPDARLGDALNAITEKKLARIAYAKKVWLQEHPATKTRTDIVEITRAGVRLLKGS